MAKTKISEFSSTPGSNTDIDGINIAEGCAPSGINDAIRELMAQLKDFQTGAAGDSFNGPVGTTTAAAGAFTTLSATGVTTVQAGTSSAPAITTSGDTNTGIFFPAADTIAFTEGGTEAMRIDSSGNVGVGTSSPSNKLSVSNGGANGIEVVPNASTSTILSFNRSTSVYTDLGFNAQNITFATGTGSSSSERMRIDSSGNVGIGTSSPYAPNGKNLNLNDAGGTIARLTLSVSGAKSYSVNSTSDSALAFYDNTAGAERARIDSSGNLLVGTTTAAWSSANRGLIELNGASTALIGLKTGNVQRGYVYHSGSDMIINASTGTLALQANGNGALIDTSGNLLVGTTSFVYSSERVSVYGNSVADAVAAWKTQRSVGQHIFLNSSGVLSGFIQWSGTTTAYNTSSDYRLKNTIAPMTGALAKVALLKPCTYKWNADDSDGEGFIAHELAEVCPSAVTGEKDAVDTDGNPVYQGIDTSFLVATLTAAIQEQQTLIVALTARVEALETK